MTEYQINLLLDTLRGLGWAIVAANALYTIISFVAGCTALTEAQPKRLRGLVYLGVSLFCFTTAAMLLFLLMSSHGVNTNFR